MARRDGAVSTNSHKRALFTAGQIFTYWPIGNIGRPSFDKFMRESERVVFAGA
jgi:hypothetical protein